MIERIHCPKCNELNEAGRQLCWICYQPLTAQDKVAGASRTSIGEGILRPTPVIRKPSILLLLVQIVGLIMLLGAGFILLLTVTCGGIMGMNNPRVMVSVLGFSLIPLMFVMLGWLMVFGHKSD